MAVFQLLNSNYKAISLTHWKWRIPLQRRPATNSQEKTPILVL